MIRFISYLALGVASAIAQDAASTPVAQPPQQQAKPSSLSASEISRLKAKAEGGDASAHATLGTAYKDGNGVTKNDALAVKWLRKAADQGEPAAENELGVIYRMGGRSGPGQRRSGAVVQEGRKARKSQSDV